MHASRSIAEIAFEELLKARKIPFVAESDLERVTPPQGGKRPDFCLDVGRPPVLAEVTELTAPGPLDGLSPGASWIDPRAFTRRIGNEIADEKVQLKPYGIAGHPTVVVLANPRHLGVPLDNRHLLQLFGEIALTMPFDGKQLLMEQGKRCTAHVSHPRGVRWQVQRAATAAARRRLRWVGTTTAKSPRTRGHGKTRMAQRLRLRWVGTTTAKSPRTRGHGKTRMAQRLR